MLSISLVLHKAKWGDSETGAVHLVFSILSPYTLQIVFTDDGSRTSLEYTYYQCTTV